MGASSAARKPKAASKRPGRGATPAPIRHLAFIPDGNRRWAKRHGLTPIAGHEKGIDRMGEVLRWCRSSKIQMVSFWAFSTENFNRDQAEVQGLFRAFATRLRKVMDDAQFDKHQVRVRFIGARSRFPFDIQQGMAQVERQTEAYSRYQVNLFIGYGGHAELIAAAQKLARDHARNPDAIDEKSFASALWTSELPDPDLIIRTSGEQRLSGFMPWQAAYSELYFCPKLWPDFKQADLQKAVLEFRRRARRWGH